MRSFVCLGLLLCAACARGENTTPTAAVRDSAGIRILEHAALDSAQAFVIGDPIYRVGDEVDEYQFVAVADGSIGSSGAAVVGDRRTAELVVIDSSGVLAWRAGGSGEGPGEYGNLSAVGWHGDTVVAYDASLGRMTYVLDGESLSSHLLPSAVRSGMIRGLGAGQMVATPAGYRPITEEPWVTMPIMHHRLGTETADTVLIFDIAPGIPPGQDNPNPLRAFGAMGANGHRIVVGRGDIAEVRLFGLDGTPQEVWRWPHPSVEITDAVWNSYAARRMERPGQRSDEEMRDYLAGLRGSARGVLPAFRVVEVDQVGRVWLDEYDVSKASPDTYRVFGARGEWLGFVTLPPGIRILDISADRMLAIQQDEFDVQSIVLLPLLPPTVD